MNAKVSGLRIAGVAGVVAGEICCLYTATPDVYPSGSSCGPKTMWRQNQENVLPPWPMLLIAGAVIGVLVASGPRLKTARPAAESIAVRPQLGDEKVDARLWQDPFEAVRNHRESFHRTVRQRRGHFRFSTAYWDGK